MERELIKKLSTEFNKEEGLMKVMVYASISKGYSLEEAEEIIRDYLKEML